MYSSEKVFIMKFLAGLRKLGVTEIPYDNSEFYNGTESMQQYFYEHRNSFGDYANELAMLFLRNPLGGLFLEFKEGIARQNGKLMSFENPYYVKAIIKLDKDGADFILNQVDLNIQEEQIIGFSTAFCEGAGIPYENVVE